MRKISSLCCVLLFLIASSIQVWAQTVDGSETAVDSPTVTPFLEARGTQLYYCNQPIKLKGFNLELIGRDADTIWRNYWEYRPTLLSLLNRARNTGSNTIRLIFPDGSLSLNADGSVPSGELDKLDNMLAELDARGMGAIVTLFNRHNYTCANSNCDRDANKARSFVTRFGQDRRVLMWDIVNEPGLTGDPNVSAGKLEWMGRMRDAVRAAGAAQLITIGALSQHELGITVSGYRSIIELSDVVSFHCYGRWTSSIPDGADGVNYRGDTYCGGCVQYIRNRTPKPILLEEFGWPDAESRDWPPYHDWHIYDAFPRNAESMDQMYREVLPAMDNKGAVGAIQWTLQDTTEHYFGLLTQSETVKREQDPASAYNTFRNWGGSTVRPFTACSTSSPPPAPTGLTATASCNAISFSWNASPGATGYYVDIAQSPSDLTNMTGTFQNHFNSTATTYTWPNLQSNTTYYWRIWAYNNIGGNHGYPSTSVRTTCGPPPAPANLTASASCSSITFSWSPAPGATGYYVDIANSWSDLVNMTNTFRNHYNATATSYTWTGLSSNTNYYWRIWAYNSSGGSHGYPNPAYVATSCGGPPPAPGGLTANPSCNAIAFAWNGSPGASGYWLDIAYTWSDLVNMTGSFRNFNAGTSTSYTVTGLPSNTTYYWRIWAWNSYGGNHGYPSPAYVATRCTSVGVRYQAHVENYGWMAEVSNNQMAGTTGESLRMEALRINLVNPSSGMLVCAQAHVENYGWMTESCGTGVEIGTTGQRLRMEAIRIRLVNAPPTMHVFYSAHVQDYGWMAEVSDGQQAGTTGQNRRIEAVRIRIAQ